MNALALKPLIAVVAIGLGVATFGYVMTIQANPLAFTRLNDESAVITAKLVNLPVPAPTSIASKLSAESSIIQIEAVTVVGRLSRPAARSWTPAPVRTVSEISNHTIAPAPCRNGEYRLLDERRGVRLMCP